jgi:hypothetical protein
MGEKIQSVDRLVDILLEKGTIFARRAAWKT